MKKVVQVLYSLDASGKAGIRLHHAFLESGIHSKIVSLKPEALKDDNIQFLGKKARIIDRLDDKIQATLTRNFKKEFGLFSYPVIGSDVSRLPAVREADIVYLHWILGGFMSIHNLDQLAALGKPVFIIMHDMWYVSGGCHYSFSCEKYKTSCNNCQMIPGNKINDLSAREFRKKKHFYSTYNNLFFISPSKWLLNCAKESTLLGDKPLFYIPNVIDNRVFKPFDKTVAKQILNIDPSETVIAFGAMQIDSPYKGWKYLQKAFEILREDPKRKNISVLIFGSGYDKQLADRIPFKVKFMGYLKEDYLLSVVYNAADVFVVPSMADNQPTVVMESMCCGTAVVAFDVGGLPDMIVHQQNGYLAKFKDSQDLADGISYCVNHKVKGSMLPSFHRNEVVKKHLDIMNNLTSTGNGI